ncbi:hypothetical protein GW17_00007189, partial [Ensete ventricosum]
NDPSVNIVVGVDLNSADIVGYLPAELNLLTDATLLHINSNRFCGFIPQIIVSNSSTSSTRATSTSSAHS